MAHGWEMGDLTPEQTFGSGLLLSYAIERPDPKVSWNQEIFSGQRRRLVRARPTTGSDRGKRDLTLITLGLTHWSFVTARAGGSAHLVVLGGWRPTLVMGVCPTLPRTLLA